MIVQARWNTAWHQLGATPPEEGIFNQLLACYTAPHRFYHNLQHLDECFRLLDATAHLTENPYEIELALWFHDAIYNTHRHDNEEQSAIWAEKVLLDNGIKISRVTRIKNLILSTDHRSLPQSNDTKYLVDIDLAILAAPEPRFIEYECQIRQEYNWVSEEIFIEERTNILRLFLEREYIYFTDFFRDRYETQARKNLITSINK